MHAATVGNAKQAVGGSRTFGLAIGAEEWRITDYAVELAFHVHWENCEQRIVMDVGHSQYVAHQVVVEAAQSRMERTL